MTTGSKRTSPPAPEHPRAAEYLVQRLEAVGAKAAEYLNKSRAANTRRAYRADWADFKAWCARYRRPAVPTAPETVAFYLADRSQDLKTSTLARRLATIAEAHRAAGFDPPTKAAQVRLVWAGIRREKGVAQNHVRPVLIRHIRLMVAHLPDSLLGVRDRALLLLGFAGAMRRSELVGLDVTDLAVSDEGLVLLIRRSKTDQIGLGRKVGIPRGARPETCPVRAVQAWLELSGIDDGPLFRSVNKHGQLRETRLSDRAVAEVVKRSLLAAGRTARRYAGHSLRAGLITQAAYGGRVGTGDPGPVGTQIPGGDAPVHPGREPVPRERSGQGRVVNPCCRAAGNGLPSAGPRWTPGPRTSPGPPDPTRPPIPPAG
ncbi:MAG: tyrosine-type recombinase/integrase [Gemmataceae bacterium]|nr:tyrosine-type recombinase/integrase [Gemmataceae bacterium]